MLFKGIAKGIQKLIYICSGIILACLCLISIFSTCTIGRNGIKDAYVFYNRDYPIVHILATIVLLGTIFLLRSRKKSEFYERAAWWILAVWGIAATVWVLLYLEQPMHDPGNVLKAARQMREYNFSSFIGDGYLNIWAGNRKLTLVFYFLSFIFGIDNFTILRVLNVAAMLISFILLYKITTYIWKESKATAVGQMLICALFVPILLYMTFVYGDTYGFCLAVAAVYAQMKYFKERKYRWIFLSAILISLAVIVKMNYLIMMIAIVIALIYDLLLHKYWKETLVFFIAIFIGITTINTGMNVLLERVTGMEQEAGVPLEAWVAMGLQDSTDAAAAGHYSGYNRVVFLENNYNNQEAKEASIESIKESIQTLKRNPGYTVSFFLRKIAAQWNNPNCGTLVGGLTKQNNLPWIVNSVQTGTMRIQLQWFLNIVQTWILFGSVCYIFLKRNKSEYEWIFLLIFLGGFLFHLIWEAGSRYAYPYYIMLIPYSCIGLVSLERKIEEFIKFERKEPRACRTYYMAGICVCILALIGLLPSVGILNTLGIVSEEKETEQLKPIRSGYCMIRTSDGSELYLTELEGNILVMGGEESKQRLSLYRSKETYVIRFQPSSNVLELAGGGAVHPFNSRNPFEWRLERVDDNKYYILMDDKTALNYHIEDWSVSLEKFEENNPGQIWEIIME